MWYSWTESVTVFIHLTHHCQEPMKEENSEKEDENEKKDVLTLLFVRFKMEVCKQICLLMMQAMQMKGQIHAIES